MKNKGNYIAALAAEITHSYCCGAVYNTTVPVCEIFEGRTAWKGDVEVFDLLNHPRAQRAYAWRRHGEKLIVIFEIPPITSPESAVRASMVSLLPGG